MELIVYKSITEIEESKWNEIIGPNKIICSHQYLTAVEKSSINDCKYFYPVVYDNDQILAHACVYSINNELDIFVKGIIKLFISLVRKFWKNFLIIKLIECGTPTAIGNTISFRENINSINALNLINQSMKEIAKKEKIKILLFRDFYEDDRSLFDNLLNFGYGITYNLPCAILKIQWNTFDEYLQCMRKDYRRNIRANRKKFNDNGIQVQLIKNFSIYAADLTKLWHNIYNRAKEYRREILAPIFYSNMDKYLGDWTEALIFKKNDTIIGCMLLLYNDNELIPLYAGLDYEMNKKYSIYFNLLYEVIEIGIKRKMKQINFEITTLETKKRLGSEIITLYMYFKHLNPILNIIIIKILNAVKPNIKLLCRKVFK